MNRKAAFTLAEVLITLGIIGVVAAMTIPTLINNYQKKQWVSGLQKGYSTISNAIKLAMATEEVSFVNQLSFYKEYPQWAGTTHVYAIAKGLSKYLKTSNLCNVAEYSKGCHSAIYYSLDNMNDRQTNFGGSVQINTLDGMTYYLTVDTPSCQQVDPSLILMINIDVNGLNGPNFYGRDLYRFAIDNNGRLIPCGSVDYCSGKTWNSGEDTQNRCDGSGSEYGVGCTARIIESGWKMDY